MSADWVGDSDTPADAELDGGDRLYLIVRDPADGNGSDALEGWPRTLDGVITATARAAWLSVGGAPCALVAMPEHRELGRWSNGRREGKTRPLLAPAAEPPS